MFLPYNRAPPERTNVVEIPLLPAPPPYEIIPNEPAELDAAKGRFTKVQVDHPNSFTPCNNNAYVSEVEEKDILHWIYPDKTDIAHEEIKSNRLSNLGNWIFEEAAYHEWSKSELGLLYCPGEGAPARVYSMLTL